MKLIEMRYDPDTPILNYGDKAQQIRRWMNQVAKIPDNRFSFNKDLSVDVQIDVRLLVTPGNARTGEKVHKWTQIPIQFNEVQGNFIMQDGEVTSMAGAPRIVHGRFNMINQRLTSLEHMPKHIGNGAWLFRNQITNLHNIHKYCSLINGSLMLSDNPIKSHVLGVLLIRGLRSVSLIEAANRFSQLHYVDRIINKHLVGDRDLVACQDELIDGGHEEFAKL